MPYETSTKIMDYCRRLGARYLTILGGEPTLHPDLHRIVDYAKSVGYEKVSIDTNGLSSNKLKSISPDKLEYIRVSLDGATAEIHDRVRGNGAFEKTLRSLRELVSTGYKVGITCTIFEFSIETAPALLDLAEELGIKLVNYHVFSEEGNGKTNSDWSLSPQNWIDFYEHLETIKDNYHTSIWYPPTWATRQKLERYVSEGYRGCLGYSLDRLSIFPDGKSHVCSVLFDEPFFFGTITDQGFVLNRENNEFEMFTKAIFQAPVPYLSGCPAETTLRKHGKKANPSEIISLCRCWKSQV